MKYYKKISKCRICGSKKIDKIVDLKSQYIQGSVIKKGYPAPYKKKIPLQLGPKMVFVSFATYIGF